MSLTPEQQARAHRLYGRWLGTVPPCGISHIDIYNPCLPEEDQHGLWCATCGLRQRLEITPPRPFAGYHIPPDYCIAVTRLVDGQFYWHVWYHGERINGGLGESCEDASRLARYAIFSSRFRRWHR